MSIKALCAAQPNLEPAILTLSSADKAKVEALDGHRLKNLTLYLGKIKDLIAKNGPGILDDLSGVITLLEAAGVVVPPEMKPIVALAITILKNLPKPQPSK
jgi:hypothetical protein